ncbi:diaminopimelate epimerase active site [Lucifera butyrica]|uniref:Diaminopimelate epimerase n=1 Tax=Lucifera butyrica TaxID=1351585 RepID=A0A498RAQ1_9FIRM|nr:diaminopimelate epimerase [Lucifera butyrica]VBB07957.1 diaminopimelate epimerase active site [Lucifera butyrica]
MQFSKMHGQGNDFVIIDGLKEKVNNFSQLAQQICDRHFGIGADGLVILLPSQQADFTMRIFNSDGSEAEMCGNASRCVARYVYEHGLTPKNKISLETLAGIIKPELLFENDRVTSVRVDMGEPRLNRGEIPVTGDKNEKAINIPVQLENQLFYGTCISMGNPHCIIFVDNVDAVDLTAIGPKIETAPLFPRKTNVEFVQVLNRHEVRMRVWERGAGITLACGTGASATLAAAVLTTKTERRITVHLDGGDLAVEWGNDNHIYMSGPAQEVFRGEYPV